MSTFAKNDRVVLNQPYGGFETGDTGTVSAAPYAGLVDVTMDKDDSSVVSAYAYRFNKAAPILKRGDVCTVTFTAVYDGSDTDPDKVTAVNGDNFPLFNRSDVKVERNTVALGYLNGLGVFVPTGEFANV